MSEDSIEQACIREVRSRGGWGVQTTGVATTGTPDFVGAYKGRALAWEFKAPGGRVSRVQQARLRMAAAAGADTAVLRSRAAAAARLDRIDEDVALADRPDAIRPVAEGPSGTNR